MVAALVVAEAPPAGAEPEPESAALDAAANGGSDTIAAIDGRTVSLRNSNSAGSPDRVFTYGRWGDTLVFGDWDGNGTDTVGAIRGRMVFLRNSNTGGRANHVFAYGRRGDRLVFGDWDGNGTDTVGVVRGRDVYLRNSNTSGRANRVFAYGRRGDRLVFGDWDGDGTDTVGVVRGRLVFLRNSNTGGRAHHVFAYGRRGDQFVFGDWDGDGTDTVGVVRGSRIFLRNSNSSGRADITFQFSAGSDRVVFGDWDGGSSSTGVLVTPTGVVVPIVAAASGGWLVRTPCGHRVRLTRGTVVDRVDIVIDPGHGGNEPGATGANGLSERTLNLAVAKDLRRLLVAEGYSVLLTRSFDHRLAIQIRAQIANALRPDLFLSIHHNGGAVVASSTPGTEVFVQHDSARSRRLGGLLYEELLATASRFPTSWVATLRAGVSSRLNAAGGDFYGVHRRTPRVVSVITEFLYLSNPPEAALLARREVQRAEARALADGIIRWFDSRDPGSGYLPDFVDTTDNGAGGFENCTDPELQ